VNISVLIPAYNGGNILKDLFFKINEVLSGRYTFEVIFIFDNGKEETWKIIKGLKKDYPDLIKAYHLANNYGQHRAIQFGMGQTLGNFVVTLDEDLQHDPADILKLAKKQKEGNYDIVYGRFSDPQHEGIHNRISFILRKILKHFLPTLYDNYSPYRFIRREIAIRISTMVCPYTFIDDFLSRVTQNIAFEDIDHHKRMEGKSSYTFMKLFKHGIYILLAYSKLIPLLLTISITFVVTGSVIFALSVISPGYLNIGLFTNRFIFATMAIGMVLIFISLIGSFINHHNTIINTRSIKLLNEDPISPKS
jgi:undecaprenyl-phosphate 4-deoxy-4-formamido-L-arabinose transferase